MRRNTSSKGAALVTVLVALLIISLMVMELQFNSMVERKLALNELNQIQAYYLAKSGIRIGLLRVNLFARARRSPELKKLGGAIDLTPYFDMIWTIPLPAFPPPKESLGKLVKSDKDAAEKVLEETKISDGQFSQVISSESSKINLNYFVLPKAQQNTPINFNDQPKTLLEYNAHFLKNLIDQFIRESENPADEYGNLKPEELILDIIDWVNPGNNRLAGGAKDSYYQQLKPPYKAKKGPFFTVEELKLVRGIDDHLYAKLKPYVTVYSDQGKVNINNANDTLLKALYTDFTEYDLTRLAEEKTRIGGFWTSEDQFVKFISENLGRSGFKTLYPKPEEYPFTVNNYSFVINSLGILKKNKAQVQKSIKVAVALTQLRGAEVVAGVTDIAQCNSNPIQFWYNLYSACYTKPRNETECQKLGSAGLRPDPNDGNKNKCYLNNQGFIPLQDDTAAASGGGSSTTKKTAPEPNAMKLLYWVES